MDRGAEVRKKLDAVRRWLDSVDRLGVLIGSQSGFAWITAGGRGYVPVDSGAGVAAVLVTADAVALLTTNIEAQRILDEELGGLVCQPLSYPWHEPRRARDAVAQLCDPDRVVSDLGEHGLARAPDSLTELRHTLLASEIERYRALGRDAAAAVEAACRQSRPGDTEHDVAARVAYECVRRDIVPFVNLVAADERIAAYRHPLPTRARLRRTLLVAVTGRRHGLHASLTRMVSFGRPDDDLARRHAAVQRVDAATNLASRPGVSLAEVFGVIAQRYADEGFPEEWRNHHQGGLTGYAGREVFATPEAGHRLDAGQATTWNPSITRVKSEDTVLVTADGPDVLTRTDEWPQTTVELDLGVLRRPALLQI